MGSTEPFVVASAAHIQHRQRLKRGDNLTNLAFRASLILRSTSAELRWMAIGDSITQAIAPAGERRRPFRHTHPAAGTCSYLSYLGTELRSRGVNPRFVGPFNEAAAGPYAADCPKPDPRHAATWGITAEQVSSNKGIRSHYRPSHIGPDGTIRKELSRGRGVYDWVRTYKPHVVSLLLGTNDLNMGRSPHQLLDDYLRPIVLQALRGGEDGLSYELGGSGSGVGKSAEGNCSLVVFIFTLLPRADDVMPSLTDLNEMLERRDRDWLRDRCIDVVSTSEGLNATDTKLFYDGLHPTNEGSQILARNIVTELSAVPSTT